MNHIGKIYIKIRKFEKQLKRDFNAYAKSQDVVLTFDQWLICQFVFEQKKTLLTTIANELCKDKASVHRIIKDLKAKNMVETVQHDVHLRYQPISLTEDGMRIIKQYNSVVRSLYTTFFKVYFDREFEILDNLLGKYG